MKRLTSSILILFELAFFMTYFSSCSRDESVISLEDANTSLNHLKSAMTNCDWTFQYVDNFNNADVSNDYGLNDILATRQLYGDWKNTTWIRKSGAWYDKVTQPWCVEVNHPYTPNALSFHLEYSAAMLNKLISTGPAGRYRVSFTTDPATGEQSSAYWTSFMLDAGSTNRGYVTQTNFGFLIGSNGTVQIFQNGNNKAVSGTVPAAAEYHVVLDIKPGSLVATVNGVQLTATLNEAIPTSAYAYLGAYIDPANVVVSSFDDLVINTQFQTAAKRILHYGYYFVSSSTYGNHFSEVSDYTNFNFIESITSETPNTNTNVLYVRWQFWADESGVLKSDWLIQWNLLLTTINQNIGKIKALYLVDEPFWAIPMSVADYNMVLNHIKADLPSLPIITVFAAPTVNDLADTRIANVSNNISWVGADEYVPVSNFSEIISLNTILGNKRSANNLFLIPQTWFSGTLTDPAVAEINWMYYNLALSNPRVIGIWNFGLWCWQTPAEVPITLEAQKLMGKAITVY